MPSFCPAGNNSSPQLNPFAGNHKDLRAESIFGKRGGGGMSLEWAIEAPTTNAGVKLNTSSIQREIRSDMCLTVKKDTRNPMTATR